MSRRKPYQFKTAPEGAPKVWRNLEDKDASPETLNKRAEAEMPDGFIDTRSLLGRRSFMVTSGASAAALSLAGCIRRPEENILPFSRAPEYVVPGVPLHFATVSERRGDAIGHLVTSHVGRPTKVEGNPEHPSSRGATDIAGQASIMDLYDPDRSVGPARSGEGGLQDSSFADFDTAFGALLQSHRESGGAGLRVLMQGTTSPTVARLRSQIATQLPNAHVHTYNPVNEDNLQEGARVAFGQPVNTLYDLQAAKVIVSIDSDFLSSEPAALRHSRSFANGRRIRNGRAEMSRLYVVESTFSNTGASADHRLRIASRDVGRYLLALAKTLSEEHQVVLGALDRLASSVSTDGIPAEWLRTVAAELASNRGRGAILVGSRQPTWVHALGHYLNYALRNNAPSGGTVSHIAATWHGSPNSLTELAGLAEAIEAGSVSTLVILGGNPVYDSPGDVDFAGLMGHAGLTTIHVASHRNETSLAASWHVPQAHELETWGDARAFDGTESIQQPLIRPMRGGRSAIEFLAQVAGERHWRAHSQVRKTFRLDNGTPGWEAAWRSALHRGVVAGSEAPASRGTSVRAEAVAAEVVQGQSERAGLGRDNLELVFVSDDRLHDGRHANNAWLLETPESMTKMVWDNAAFLSVQTAQELGITSGDMLRISRGDANIEIAAWVIPGHADWSVSLPLGWGRTAAGEYGNGCGFDVNPLRASDGFDFTDGARVERTGGTYQLVQTQTHHSMEGRPLAIDATLEAIEAPEGGAYHGLPAYSDEPDFGQRRAVEFTNGPLWEEADYSQGHKWGMAIDLTTCTGCNTCVVACQAENNIPTVGKGEVQRGREMHWIRIDRYFVGDDMNDPIVALQPVACQQCEEAPCENVCPVNATTHSPEGLNDMAYNRCVGTRYCANNCPYKVRRFNYLDWHGSEDPHGYTPETVQMAFNPNVTVRMRGVIEKCSYCVQRIQEARISARREDRELQDGDITPACSQSCASQSIVFGDLNDTSSRVAQLVQQDQRYRLLEEVGAQPRTTYLGQVRNPNPMMFASAAGSNEEAES